MRHKSAGYWWRAAGSTAVVWTARYAIIGCLIAAFSVLSVHDHLLLFSRNLLYKIVLMMSVTPGAAGIAEVAFPAFFGLYLGASRPLSGCSTACSPTTSTCWSGP